MPESSNSPEGVRIAVHVLAMLSHHRALSCADIHHQLEALGFQRTRRSIQRLMDDLTNSFEIECDDRSKPYGYRWKANSRGLGLPRLDDREALVLLLARQHLEPLLPASVMKTMKPLFEDARRQLDPYRGARQLRTWPYKVAVVSQLQPLIPPKLANAVLENVTEALQADQWLDIDYRNFAGELHKAKRVMPLALVQQGARLFLVCQFDGYADRRHLALHRIQRATAVGLGFERPPFDLQAYIEEGRFGFGYGEKVTLQMEVSESVADLLSETPVSPDQSIERRKDGVLVLSATVVRSQQLRWWIRTYGNAVRVLAPAGLLDEEATRAPDPATTTAAKRKTPERRAGS